jgi:hypothetical protein
MEEGVEVASILISVTTALSSSTHLELAETGREDDGCAVGDDDNDDEEEEAGDAGAMMSALLQVSTSLL